MQNFQSFLGCCWHSGSFLGTGRQGAVFWRFYGPETTRRVLVRAQAERDAAQDSLRTLRGELDAALAASAALEVRAPSTARNTLAHGLKHSSEHF